MSSESEQLEVDYMLLADRAEVLNNKIYMMGGGWDRRFIRNIEGAIDITIVIGVLVPWNLTNELHEISVRIIDDDGQVTPPEVRARVTAGRPPEAVQGQAFRVSLVFNANWKLPKFGAYSVEASLPNRILKKAGFYLMPAAGTPARQ